MPEYCFYGTILCTHICVRIKSTIKKIETQLVVQGYTTELISLPRRQYNNLP